MATSAVQFNAAVTALLLLWQDYLDSLAAGTVVKIYPHPSGFNGTALNTGASPSSAFNATGDGTGQTRVGYTIKKANSTDNMIYELPGVELGRVPLFFKVNSGATESIADS